MTSDQTTSSTNSSAPVVVSEPMNRQDMINKIIADEAASNTNLKGLPVANDAEEDPLSAPLTQASDSTKTSEEQKDTKAEKKESKSSKAAKDSKALRMARQKEQELTQKLKDFESTKQGMEQFKKAQELFKTNPKEAIKLLGSDVNKAYQQLTQAYLDGDPEMKAKDPVQEKLALIDPYLETIKKKEAQLAEQINNNNIREMISKNVSPIIDSKKDQLECLFDYFNPNGALSADNVKQTVARTVFDNAEEYFVTNFKGDHSKLLKEYGNYETYFTRVAEHLEKQLELQLDQSVQRAAKLTKFKNKFQSNSAHKQAENTKEIKVLDENSNSLDINTLDDVINSSAKNSPTPWQSKDTNKRAEIEKLLKANKLL